MTCVHSLCFDLFFLHFFIIKATTKAVASVRVVAAPTPTPIAIAVVSVVVSVSSVVSDAIVVVVERCTVVVPVVAAEETS